MLDGATEKARTDWLLGLGTNRSAPDDLVMELFHHPGEPWHRSAYLFNRDRRDVVTEAAINHPERKVRMLLVEVGGMTADQWNRLIDTFPDTASRGLAEEYRDAFLGLVRRDPDVPTSPAEIARRADAEEHVPAEAHTFELRWIAALHDDPEAMRQLAAHPNRLIRRNVARAGHLPPDVVDLLAQDEDRVVHLFLSESCDDTPAEVLLSVWSWWSGSFSFPGRPRNHPNFPKTGLLRYADDPDPHWRLLALADESSTPELVDRFAADPEFDVRLEAALDPRISPAALAPLLLEERLATNAARNTSIPVPVMRHMIELARRASPPPPPPAG